MSIPTAPTANRLNDVLRARAQAKMVEQQRLAALARLARARARNIRIAIVATTVVATLFGVVLYFSTWLPGQSPPMWPLEASTKKFVATKSGQIRTPISGNKCREVNFDNNTGQFSNDTVVACDEDLREEQSVNKAIQAKNFNNRPGFRDAFR